MLLPAVTFSAVILAIHVLFVVACFGVIVAYPLISITAERLDRRTAPMLHRIRVVVARVLVNPGLLIVTAAGIYLAADWHQFKHFYVQWGIAAVIVLGALEGVLTIRGSKQLAEIAQRDIDAADGGEIKWSVEYVSKKARADIVAVLMAVIVLVTVFLMAVQ